MKARNLRPRPAFAYERVQPYCPGCGMALPRGFPLIGQVEALMIDYPTQTVCVCGWVGQALWARSQEKHDGT